MLAITTKIFIIYTDIMNNIQKRFMLFLLGCIPTRLFLVYLAKNIPVNYLPVLGYISLLPAIGFIYLFLSGTRKSGPETFGDKIWWNNLRPVHAIFYLLFSYNAINKVKDSWIYLLYDIIFGLISFLIYHYINNDFTDLHIKNAEL
jgi:hypothetical protein